MIPTRFCLGRNLALFSSLVLLIHGNSMLSTLMAVRLDFEGGDAGLVGVVLALYSVGFVLR